MRPPSLSGRLRAKAAAAVATSLVVAGAAWLTGCTPEIGDSCQLSTDCASDGTRVCDTSEPGGFCTVLNCTGNELGAVCPDNALCVLFNPNVPGCPNSVRSPSRIASAQCRNTCSQDSDCRGGYFCRSPLAAPWSAQILDTAQTDKICLPYLVFIDGGTSPQNYAYDGSLDAIPAVCQASIDAAFPSFDAFSFDAGPDGGDAGDAGLGGDAGPNDGGADASKGDAARDASKDATKDAAKDAHAKDASQGDAADAG